MPGEAEGQVEASVWQRLSGLGTMVLAPLQPPALAFLTPILGRGGGVEEEKWREAADSPFLRGMLGA